MFKDNIGTGPSYYHIHNDAASTEINCNEPENLIFMWENRFGYFKLMFKNYIHVYILL